MARLTISEILRWDPKAIDAVFRITKDRERRFEAFGTDLAGVQKRLSDWGGSAGEAFHQEMGKRRVDIDADGREAKNVGAAIDRADQDVENIQTQLKGQLAAAADDHLYVSDEGVVSIQDGFTNDPAAIKAQPLMQDAINHTLAQAGTVEEEIATAIRAAVGDVQLDADGRPLADQPPPQPEGKKVPGPDGDPPYDYHDGQAHPPPTMIPDAKVIPLADNPPGYTGGPGPARDKAWQDYLNGINRDGTRRVPPGTPPAVLPKPEAVQDKGLRAIAAAGRQQGISYAWGANKSVYGPTKGTLEGDPPDGDAHKYGDNNRTGFDCGGLVRFSIFQATGNDPFAHTGPDGPGTDQLDTSRYLTPVKGGIAGAAAGQIAQPGDVLVFGNSGHEAFSGSRTHHTGIYVGNGVIIDAPSSGLPVRLHRLSGWADEPTDVLRAK